MTLPPAYCPLDNQIKQKLRFAQQAGGRVTPTLHYKFLICTFLSPAYGKTEEVVG